MGDLPFQPEDIPDFPQVEGDVPNLIIYPELLNIHPAHIIQALIAFLQGLIGTVVIPPSAPTNNASELFFWIIEHFPTVSTVTLVQFIVHWVNVNIHGIVPGVPQRGGRRRSKKKGSRKKRSKRRYKRKSRKSRKY
jgi:hypothetical protein